MFDIVFQGLFIPVLFHLTSQVSSDMALIDIPVSEPVRFEKLYGKSKLDIPGGIGQNNGTGPTGFGFWTCEGIYMSNIFETAVALVVKNGAINVVKASSGGYIPTNESDMDEMFGLIIEQKLPIAQYSFWIVGAEAEDYKSFGIKAKPYTSKYGKAGISHDGNITTAQFKKVLAACDVNVELVKRPFPQPKITARLKNKPKVTARSENRIGR